MSHECEVLGKGSAADPSSDVAAAIVALGLSVGSAAQAADFCFASGPSSFVGKGFKLPTKGRCKPFTGWKLAYGTWVYTVTGTACTDLSGDFTDFNLISQVSGSLGAMLESIRLPLVPGAPDTYGYELPNGGTAFLTGTSIAGVPCMQPYNP